MIHLDTGFLIRALVRNSAEDLKLRSWLKARTRVAISCIARAELCSGIGIDKATGKKAEIIALPWAVSEVGFRGLFKDFLQDFRHSG
jgi:predicted nucleic acid-binding protein